MPPSTTVSGSLPVFVDLLSALQPMPPPLAHRTETHSQLTVCVPLAWQSPRVRGRGVDQGRRADASWARLISCPPSSTGSSNPTLLWASGLQRAALRSWRAARAPLFPQTSSLARTSTRGRPRRRARVQRRLRRDTGGLRATLLLDARAVDSGPHYLCACEIVGRALARMHMHVRS